MGKAPLYIYLCIRSPDPSHLTLLTLCSNHDRYEEIQAYAREAERLFEDGQFAASTNAWAATQGAVFRATGSVDFYNILTKMAVNSPDTRSAYGKSPWDSPIFRVPMLIWYPLMYRSLQDKF